MTEFVKLYGSILDSTVWLEALPTKVVWITMLAMADWNGFVSSSVPGLAKRAGVTRQECDEALATLASPDPDSKTKDHEGRRIVVVDGGWRLLNYAAYRERRSNGAGGDAAACYVYYAVDGDRVKIGSSKNPWARAVTLRRELNKPDIKIEAVEHGGYELEFNRHDQFVTDRIQGEWFRRSDAIQAHIASLPRRHPKLTTVAKKVGKVATSKLAIANGDYKDVDKEKTTTPAKSSGWVGRFLTAYTEATKGAYSAGRLGRELKDLIRDNGENPAFIAWTAFLASPDRKYGPPYFAKNYVDYSEGRRNGHPSQEEQFRKRGILL